MKKGRIAQIEFLDHMIDPKGQKYGELMKFRVWGVVEKITKKEVTIRTWELQSNDADLNRHNNELARILTSSIVDVKFLEVISEMKSEN